MVEDQTIMCETWVGAAVRQPGRSSTELADTLSLSIFFYRQIMCRAFGACLLQRALCRLLQVEC